MNSPLSAERGIMTIQDHIADLVVDRAALTARLTVLADALADIATAQREWADAGEDETFQRFAYRLQWLARAALVGEEQ